MADGDFQKDYHDLKSRHHTGQNSVITATPFVLRDAVQIPRRAWIYGHHLIRRFVSLTVSPGGVGKTALLIADSVALVTGRDLVQTRVYGDPKRVWLFNLEDPLEELERRIAATCQHYGIDAEALSNRLFVDSGRDQPLCITEQVDGQTRIAAPVTDQLVEQLVAMEIDVLIIDPFVSSHGAPENDNGAIDKVAKEWGRVAERANCAIELAHHLRKMGEQEATAESSRGAVALVAAARSVRVLNRMTKKEAEAVGEKSNREFFNAVDDKNNLAPPATEADWFRLVSVPLANGDNVGVVERWSWPDPFGGVTDADLRAVQEAVDGKNLRENVQANDWIGKSVAKVMHLDLSNQAHKSKVKALIKTWIRNDALVVSQVKDEKGKYRPIIEVGVRATSE
jgi:hypothetical protein